ncbi:hypothetical protein [Streptomyces sp. I05A-00742]|uniref:hypothetical protein n=1 Tax=Streptomyces sp. I05A-00742 TaxID=2732853 RepID=UPI0014883A9E|nr:hypothetical protein [Streptomyces sp. I05A-00742]
MNTTRRILATVLAAALFSLGGTALAAPAQAQPDPVGHIEFHVEMGMVAQYIELN